MFKKIVLSLLAIVLVIVLVLAVVISLQPASFRVERSAKINARPDVVFGHISDLRKWETWSPWAKLDPNVKYTYSDPTHGKGAKCSWVGNSDVGEGHMTVLESDSPNLLRIKLEFIKPFEATSTSEFTFKAEGDQTLVTWTMSGENNFMAKAMHLFMDLDKLIGNDFEKGLANIKAASEKSQ